MKFIKNIRENLKDPKKKSLTLLGMYFIFFIFVFIVIKAGESYPNQNYVVEEKSNYEYTYKIYDNENYFEINVNHKNNIDYFNYLDNAYENRNGKVYLNNEEVELDFDVSDYNYDTIKKLIEISESETKYKDSEKIDYNINILKYFEILNEQNNCNEECSSINITLQKEGDKYIIDLSNYYNYTYKVEIEYSFK